RRLRVKPGITGIAQVKWKYDQSVEDVRQKVKYDLFYISNMSLRMDLKILFATVRTMLSGKGH
ncbi:MAG TPA: sugar transferase, partial [Rhodothermia bacterium]|nr:sugar transferase [Rhodothermia bacterium]